MKKCDICDEATTELYALRDCYKQKDIGELCWDCKKMADHELDRIVLKNHEQRRAELRAWLRGFRAMRKDGAE